MTNHILYRTVSAFILMLIVASGTSVMGVPAKPSPIEVTTDDGEKLTLHIYGDERLHYAVTEDGAVIMNDGNGRFSYAALEGDNLYSTGIRYRKNSNHSQHLTVNKLKGMMPTPVETQELRSAPESEHIINISGEMITPVILVEYADVKFSIADPRESFDRQLNEPGHHDNGATGSVHDYYKESSNGQFIPRFEVFGPITLQENRAYYGSNNDSKAYRMAIEAALATDEIADFSRYDNDGDGFIDNIYVIYAGHGEHDSYIEEAVWPHSFDIRSAGGKTVDIDGVTLNHYACGCELDYEADRMTGIGLFCHEFSHVLGLPDLYNTSGFATDATPGEFSVMAFGGYNNGQMTPPLFTGWERYVMGWTAPTVLTEDCMVSMRAVSDGGYDDLYIIPTARETEYFLLENRQKKGWDAYIGESTGNGNVHGMVVWHIDYNKSRWISNTLNNLSSHQHIDIVEADGVSAYSHAPGATFPGSAGVTEFSPIITWKKETLPCSIIKIAEQGGLINFTFDAGDASGIDNITTDSDPDNNSVRYYNLQGTETAGPEPGQHGIYLRRKGNKWDKVAY